MFKNPFSFSGRIRRTEFGLSMLIYYAVLIALELTANEMKLDEITRGLLTLIVIIPMIWFVLAQGAKRCHDLEKNGWFQIIPFYIFWLIFSAGRYGINKYGPNPKGLGNIDEIDEIGNYLNT